MDLPSITVITPCMNSAATLQETLESVRSQKYPRLEHIVVDGGSTDGSVDIIRRYEAHLAWWVSEPDEGRVDAANKGLRMASGDVVAWLNADDRYEPGALHAVGEALARNSGERPTISSESHQKGSARSRGPVAKKRVAGMPRDCMIGAASSRLSR